MTNPDHFPNLAETLPLGIFRAGYGHPARILYANAALRRMMAWPAKEAARFRLADMFSDRRQLKMFLDCLNAEGACQNFEARLEGGGKKSFAGALSARLLKDPRSSMRWIDGVVEDVSRRKRYEKDLLESKELFRTVFNNTAAAITVTDKDERIVAWNPFAEKMLGMDKSDLFNKPVKDLYPPEEWRRMRGFRIRQKGMLADIETQIYRQDGSILEASVSVSVLKDAEGNVTGSIGIIRDITAQKTAERRMKENENKIRVILDNSAAGITLTDEQERIISWNKFTEHLLGYKKEELYLRPVSSIYPEEEWKKIRSENIRHLGSKHHLETKVVNKNGHAIDVDLSINVLTDADNKIIGSVGIMQDITRQKRFQEMLLQAKLAAEEANSAKSLFLANMSHEVRTPMNTVLGMLDLTLDTELSQEQKDNLTVAKEAAGNLLSLLNDILDLSRVEAGKINLEDIDFHLHNVARSVCKGMSVLARDKHLEVALDIQPDVPEMVVGDPVRLRQVLVNLINNAIKFTHKGKITLGIRNAPPVHAASVPRRPDESVLLFSVMDEGIGIAKASQQKIFDAFTQADSSTTRRFGGTGLGLAICKRLVEMMGGAIWVASEELKGSTFYFTAVLKIVPVSKAAPSLPSAHAPGEEEQTSYEDLKELRVLLAEDNIVNQKITVRLLEKQGWKVSAVVNGQEVLELLNKEQFDVILMDAHMPIIDGWEATRLIRKEEEKTGKHIPVVALTARAMQEDRKNCLEAGMDGYVAKPIDRKKMFEEIAAVVKKWRAYV